MPKKNYKPGDIVDLDDVNISLPAYLAWQASARAAAAGLAATGRITHPSQIPDEQVVLDVDGSLEIFVDIPGTVRVSMMIPPSQWVWR